MTLLDLVSQQQRVAWQCIGQQNLQQHTSLINLIPTHFLTATKTGVTIHVKTESLKYHLSMWTKGANVHTEVVTDEKDQSCECKLLVETSNDTRRPYHHVSLVTLSESPGQTPLNRFQTTQTRASVNTTITGWRYSPQQKDYTSLKVCLLRLEANMAADIFAVKNAIYTRGVTEGRESGSGLPGLSTFVSKICSKVVILLNYVLHSISFFFLSFFFF
jgi:hypothetical protein